MIGISSHVVIVWHFPASQVALDLDDEVPHLDIDAASSAIAHLRLPLDDVVSG